MAEHLRQHRAPPPWRRRLAALPAAGWFVLAVVAALVGATVVTVLAARSPSTLRSQLLRTDVSAPGQAQATVQVFKAPLASAVCDLSAQDASGAAVGAAQVTAGPDAHGHRVVDLAVTIPTRARAVTVVLTGCRITRTR